MEIRRPTKPIVGLAKGKGRFHDVIFYIQNFATFGFYKKINATKRLRRVYYTRMSGNLWWFSCVPIYNTRWRGLAELLISVEKAM